MKSICTKLPKQKNKMSKVSPRLQIKNLEMKYICTNTKPQLGFLKTTIKVSKLPLGYRNIYVCVHGCVYIYIYKPPKKILSYLSSMLKTNINKNKNFNKKHVSSYQRFTKPENVLHIYQTQAAHHHILEVLPMLQTRNLHENKIHIYDPN